MGYMTYPMRDVGDIESRLGQGSILAAALGVFERKGFAATRVEDILEAAGVARRTFYKQFKSKEDVLAALYTMAMGEILAALQTDVEDAPEHPLGSIHRAIDVYLDYHAKNAGTLRVLLGQAMRPDSPLFEQRRSFRAALVRILSDVADKRGKDFAPLVFVALVSAVEGLSLELLETGARPRDIAIARQTTHALLAKVFDVKGPALPNRR
jgi:AcrR family transcriptional regulator